MNYFFWILVGIIIGWIIEWVIDWLFWRKPAGVSPEKLAEAEAENRRLQAQLAESQQRLAQLEAEHSQRPTLGERSMPSRSVHMPDLDATIAQTRPVQKDRLEVIEGIGPVYARRLNEAGIFSFAQLAELSAARVREIIKPEEWQKIEPESWIAQAIALASPDFLEDIDGIGPEYAQRLNQAGIYTFAQLVEAGPERLRQIIDPEKWQKIEPEKWIAEARQFAARKSDQSAKGA